MDSDSREKNGQNWSKLVKIGLTGRGDEGHGEDESHAMEGRVGRFAAPGAAVDLLTSEVRERGDFSISGHSS